ncbi:Altered inheritance of mitochondria protein 41 mitochondrial [Pichia californica]|uniref:Altered inheritance of mitochondria protein 41 n=1 Tax=Pichia californica TaxID=460514 RepID=A0A9P6WJ43_9ASCO|nr:Altered inheritance of mitochondria protein 41 mitochondrial [[Candida] californica]KAG0688086.1 Altered inheritance of mitochondria protein 41 mitochondrial [[Candida] californica]
MFSFARTALRFNSTATSTAGPLYDGFLVTLRNDLKACIRNKSPAVEKTTVRGIMSEMKNLEIENHGSIVDEFKIYDHLNKLIRQRNETAAEYLKPDQPERFKELAEKEIDEAKIISKYLNALPVASEEEIKLKLVDLMKSEGITDKKKLFPKIPWAKINTEWKASKGAVSNAINKL